MSEVVNKSASAVVAVVALVAVALAALLISPQLLADGEVQGPSVGAPSPTATAAIEPTGEVTRVSVSVAGMAFVPAVIEVPAGNTLEVTLENTGDQRHDLVFANGAETGPLAPGAQATIEVGVISESMEGWCSIPGHRQMGMVLQVVAIGGQEVADDDASAGHQHSGMAVDVPTMTQLQAHAATEEPHPAIVEPAPAETEHFYEFVVTEDTKALADGVVIPLWTFNGTAPGPTLRGKVGDTFHITLKNEGTMGHSVDFHAGDISPDEPMRTIEPGESLEYVFTANRSGIWMYHCSTMPMALHIANGMFGAVIIDPPGLESVDAEFVLIHSDVVVPQASRAEGEVPLTPDLVAFNGRPFQYGAHPLQVQAGDRVRMWVLDVGPNAPVAFHVVGTQFDTVWSEGGYSVYHGQSTDGITQGETGAQVLSLQAAEGGFVEFVPYEAGNYTFVNHIMSLAEAGAQGVLQVTE